MFKYQGAKLDLQAIYEEPEPQHHLGNKSRSTPYPAQPVITAVRDGSSSRDHGLVVYPFSNGSGVGMRNPTFHTPSSTLRRLMHMNSCLKLTLTSDESSVGTFPRSCQKSAWKRLGTSGKIPRLLRGPYQRRLPPPTLLACVIHPLRAKYHGWTMNRLGNPFCSSLSGIASAFL